MTRETKIGLLVGLAFIIVIGILLSDHLSSTVQSPLVQRDERNMDGGLLTPGARKPLPPPIQDIQPDRPIITNPEPRSEADIFVGPRPGVASGGNANGPERIEIYGQGGSDTGGHATPPAGGAPGAVAVAPSGNLLDPPNGTANPSNNLLAAENRGGAIVIPQHDPPVIPSNPEPPLPVIQVQQYTAEPGDTVSKMAMKFLGSRNPANLNLILKVNPDLAANPHKVVVGQKYNIPVAPAAPADGDGGGTTASTGAGTGRTPPSPSPSPTATGSATVYTTKANDTLWGIASRECGSASFATVNQIKELNKDVLNGKDLIRPNMKLRLPPKPAAAASASVSVAGQ
jgi:nucleoid-associated protein YgaU